LVNEKITQCHLGRFLVNQDFGFDGAFKVVEEDDECIDFRISIPKAVTLNFPAWKEIQAVVQSIALFTEFVRPAYTKGVDSLKKTEKRQLLSLFVVAEHERSLYAVAGDYSDILCDWLEDVASKQEMENIAKAMEQTYSYIWDRPPGYGTFLAYLQGEGELSLQCPSNCVVYTRMPSMDKGGVEFDSSEVCHPAEVLVLLSGLSVLYEQAGRESYGSSY
jgi:hypothetical protein